MTWNSTLRPDLYRDILIFTVVDNEKVALFYKQYIV